MPGFSEKRRDLHTRIAELEESIETKISIVQAMRTTVDVEVVAK